MLLYTAVYVLALQALGVLRQIDPRVRDLILAVKIWAQRRGINEAFKGTLNSFYYYLNSRLLLMPYEVARLLLLPYEVATNSLLG